MRSHLLKPKGAPQCHSQFICLLCHSEVIWTGCRCQAFLPLPLERNGSQRLALMPLFLIKPPCYQPSQSDRDVLIKLTQADWHWLSEHRFRIFSVLLPLLLHFHFCIFVKEHFFLKVLRVSSVFTRKAFNSVWRKCCSDRCLMDALLSWVPFESDVYAFEDT